MELKLLAVLLALSSDCAASSFSEGVRHMKAGRLEEAIVSFEEAEDSEPGSAEVLMNLGWAYWRNRRVDDAARCFELLVRLDPRNPLYLRLLADVEDERGNRARALTLARSALELLPGDRDCALSLAKVLVHLERDEEATRILERLVQQYPDHPSVQFRYADHLASLGRLEEALVFYDKLIHSDPDNTAFRRGRAGVLYELGHFDQAMTEWRRLASLPEPDEKSLINLGWASWHARSFDDAGKYGSMLVELEPSNIKFLKFLSNIRLEQKSPEEALKLAKRALAADSDDRDASLLMAKALFRLQRPEEAMKVMTRLLKRFPEVASLRFHMGDFLIQLGRIEEALVYFDGLVKDAPTNRVYRRRRAAALYDLGRFEEARAEWRLLAGQKPADLPALERLATDAYDAESWDEALRWIRELAGAKALGSGDWVRLALIYRGQGRLLQAVDAADKALEVDKQEMEARFIKAESYEALKDYPAAERFYEEILSLNPSNVRALQSLARVAEARGDLDRAIRLVRTVRSLPMNTRAAGPYLAIEEARLLGEARRMAQAVRTVKAVSGRHRLGLPVLLYHGVSAAGRKDRMTVPLELFKAHMAVLKRLGYETVTVSELAAFGRGDGVLPAKPVLITFDDARVDAFRAATPVLEAHGFRATMFAHLSALRRGGFNATPAELKKWQATGRWDIQAHGDMAHDPIRVDEAGRKGHFLSNLMWLPMEGRMETPEEYAQRVENDFRSVKATLESIVGSSVTAFAYPFGDNGHAGYSNTTEAPLVNQRLVRKYFSFSFVQDQWGHNVAPYDNYDLTRFEVLPSLTADELAYHLTLKEPWVKARMLEASLWTRAGQPGRSLSLLGSLERYGVKDPELLAQKGLAARGLGDAWDAQRYFRGAREARPDDERYQRLVRQGEEGTSPAIGPEGTGFSDTFSVITRGLARASANLGPLALGGWAGRGVYRERQTSQVDASGVEVTRPESRLASKELGGRARVFLTPRVQLDGSLASRLFDDSSVKATHDYSMGMSGFVAAPLRLGFSHARRSVETPRALRQGVQFTSYGGEMKWDVAMAWIADASFDRAFYDDGNRQGDLRAGLTRRILNRLSVGYAFRHLESDRRQIDYYSPGRLNQHMGLVTASQAFGRENTITGLRPFELRGQYGAGYGWHDTGSRAVQSVRGGLVWRFMDRLSVSADAQYTGSPAYVSRGVSVGLGFTL